MLDICSTSIILTLLQNFKRLNACLINIHIPTASHGTILQPASVLMKTAH